VILPARIMGVCRGLTCELACKDVNRWNCLLASHRFLMEIYIQDAVKSIEMVSVECTNKNTLDTLTALLSRVSGPCSMTECGYTRCTEMFREYECISLAFRTGCSQSVVMHTYT